ncbi:MAG: exodeoxyribonuclease VII small subunit [Clostridium sp.]|nr:exodeoxyribonuclease VII small subunit [Clostridium sp.]
MENKNESYEKLMSKLEKIVSSMEDGNLTLEKTMANYEQGVSICNKLYKYLNEAEGKIKILSSEGEKEFLKSEE